MSNIETLCDLSRRQVPVHFDCGQDLVIISGEWTTRAGSIGEVYISGMKARKSTLASVSTYGRVSIHTTYLTLYFHRFESFSEEE